MIWVVTCIYNSHRLYWHRGSQIGTNIKLIFKFLIDKFDYSFYILFMYNPSFYPDLKIKKKSYQIYSWSLPVLKGTAKLGSVDCELQFKVRLREDLDIWVVFKDKTSLISLVLWESNLVRQLSINICVICSVPAIVIASGNVVPIHIMEKKGMIQYVSKIPHWTLCI